jgi:rhodanese-related sulfurtransferase
MNELIQFAQANLLLSLAWVVVAVSLAATQFRIMATGPKALSSQMLTDMVNRQNGVVIDIRPKAEFAKGHIHGAINIPLSTVKDRIKDLEKYQNTPIIMVCANGISVAGACSTLKKSGLQQVHKLAGGMSSWVGDNLPVVK